ncbi:MAG: bifunctional hydroxymethylpyrimidine kinase/phosphomethylpyrimidine kinase [Alphaproteobacteria bacterium]
MPTRVLVVGESDSSGAAGIQADMKTVMALGGYAMTAVSAVWACDTRNIITTQSIAPADVAAQMVAAIKDITVEAIKLGFLENEAMINAVGDVLDTYRESHIPVVVDPSITSRGGHVLVDNAAISAWKRRLYVHAKILTPNLKEAELLGGMPIETIDDIRHEADMMRTLGVENVVLKGGQVEPGKELYFVATHNEERIYERPSLQTRHTLGAGNTLASALALNAAKHMDIFQSVENALDFLHQAMLHSPGFGRREGPVNHAFDILRHPSSFHPETIKLRKIN